jgi:hypothetical protein
MYCDLITDEQGRISYVPSGGLNGLRPFPGMIQGPPTFPARLLIIAGWFCCRCGRDENFDPEFPADMWTCRFCGESACSTCWKRAVAAA